VINGLDIPPTNHPAERKIKFTTTTHGEARDNPYTQSHQLVASPHVLPSPGHVTVDLALRLELSYPALPFLLQRLELLLVAGHDKCLRERQRDNDGGAAEKLK